MRYLKKKCCFIQTVITSVLLTLMSFLINVLYFQGGVQASCSRFHCVWPPAAARCSSSSKGLLQLHRKLLLSQHISDRDRQPGIPWLVLPGAVTQSHGISLVMLNKSPYRCVIGQLYLSQWICVQSLIPRPARRWWCPCAQMASRTCLNPRSGTSRPSLMDATSCLVSGHEPTGQARSTGGRTSPLTATSSLGKQA